MTGVRPDNRLADAPMAPVSCSSCAARVLVRKSSWEQTSVQWDAEALARCHHRQALSFHTCPELRAAIEDAVRHGDLVIVADAH